MSAIAIFVKTPGISAVKSRLAASIGQRQAEQCHRRCAEVVSAIAVAAAVGPVYWAVAEAEGLDHPDWRHLPRLLQRGDGLGERMRSVHDELCRRHGAGMLIGADLPQLETSQLQAAAGHLQAGPDRGVIGPAADGGFWLIGANRRLPAAVWNAPVYGSSSVAERFMRAVGEPPDWLRLDPRSDLDHFSDLDAVIEELQNLGKPHPLQSDLLECLRLSFDNTTQDQAFES